MPTTNYYYRDKKYVVVIDRVNVLSIVGRTLPGARAVMQYTIAVDPDDPSKGTYSVNVERKNQREFFDCRKQFHDWAFCSSMYVAEMFQNERKFINANIYRLPPSKKA